MFFARTPSTKIYNKFFGQHVDNYGNVAPIIETLSDIELNEDEINTLVDFINYFVYEEQIFLNEDPELSNLLNKLEYAKQKQEVRR